MAELPMEIMASIAKALMPAWQTFSKVVVIQALFGKVKDLTPNWAFQDKMRDLDAMSSKLYASAFNDKKAALDATNDAHRLAFAFESIAIAVLALPLLIVLASLAFAGRKSFGAMKKTVVYAILALFTSIVMHNAAIWYDHAPYTHTIIAMVICIAFPCAAVQVWMSLPSGEVYVVARQLYSVRDEVGSVRDEVGSVQDQLMTFVDQLDKISRDVQALKKDRDRDHPENAVARQRSQPSRSCRQ
jgi:hypothetical protein